MAGRPKGTPKTGGRRPGIPNKVTADIKAIAQQYGKRAIQRLVQIMENDEAPHAAQVAASRELLNRGYGQSQQSTDITNSDGSLSHPGYAVIPEQAEGMEAWTQQTQSSSQIQTDE
ncbi:hypothetical protein [Dyella caseinilytica]|uniref:hypothetical protein n=1 Tax=Dyella caseinilytica TaxID=1849581 RepID=UPI00193F2127|nr:hypothetical protein [Dyella caseinilytica]GGA00370.1 hypothetical protein GCM10011408_21610 [Dyella caseinilytica]